MEKMQQAIIDFFSNHKLLKNIRTGLVILLLLIIPIIYFGFIDTFSFAALFKWEFGAIIFVVTLSIILATWETKSLAFDITRENDKDNELIDLEKEVETKSDTIRELDKKGKRSVKWISLYNKEQQTLYNEIKTNERISTLEKRALNYRINGKDKKAEWCDKEIKRISKSALIDKKFIAYDSKRIMGTSSLNIKLPKTKGNSEINVNPKKINWVMIVLRIPISASGVGVLGSIPFLFSASIATIFWFYIGYLITIGITIITQYLLTAQYTTKNYRRALKTIIKIQGLLIEHLQKKEVPKKTTKKTTKKKA